MVGNFREYQKIQKYWQMALKIQLATSKFLSFILKLLSKRYFELHTLIVDTCF